MADQILRSGSITFSLPDGDDKDNNTKVDVSVITRFNDQFDLLLANKSGFAGTDTWEDTGDKSYTYSLDVTPVSIAQINSGLKTTITIRPNGDDTVIFNYRLSLIFDDGNPNTAQIELVQTRESITLSQDDPTFNS